MVRTPASTSVTAFCYNLNIAQYISIIIIIILTIMIIITRILKTPSIPC